MSQTSLPATALPILPAAALAGVRSRRLCAWLVDALFIAALTWLFGFLMVMAALPTLGFSFAAAPLLGLIGVFYSGLTVSGEKMSTWGQRMFGLVLTTRAGERLDFITAAGHALLFWLTMPLCWAPALLALFNGEKRTLHDYLTGVIVTRRLPAA